jgi:hypothetical protein
MVDFEQLLGHLVTITTADGKHHFGEVKGFDQDGWVFINSYGRTTAVDTMAVVSITIPKGYLGKGVFRKEE